MARFFSLSTGLTGLATVFSPVLPKDKAITNQELVARIKKQFPFLTFTKTPVLTSYQKQSDGTYALKIQLSGKAETHCIAETPKEAIALARRRWVTPRKDFLPVHLEDAVILPETKKDKEKEALYRRLEAQYYLEKRRQKKQKEKEEVERKRRQKEIAKFQDKTHPRDLTPKAFKKLVDVLFTLAESKQGARALKVAGLTLGILALDAQLRAMHMAFAATPNGYAMQDPTQNSLLRHLLGQRNIRRLLGYSPRLLQRNPADQVYAPRDVLPYLQTNPDALEHLARANGDRQIEQAMLLDRSPEGRAYLEDLSKRTGIENPSFVDLLQQPTVTDYVARTYDDRLQERENLAPTRVYPDTIVPLDAVLLPSATRTLAEDALRPDPEQTQEQADFRQNLRAAILTPSLEPPLVRAMERTRWQEEEMQEDLEDTANQKHFLDGLVAKDVARDAIESMRVLQQEENAPDEERQEGRLLEADRAIAILRENNDRIAPLAYINKDLISEQARVLDESREGRDYLRQLRRKTGIENPSFEEILKAPSVPAYVAGVYEDDLAMRNQETLARKEGQDALQTVQKACDTPTASYDDLLSKDAPLTLAEDALSKSSKNSMEQENFYQDMRDLIEQPKSGHEELGGIHAPLMEAMGRMNVRGVFPETQESVFSSLGIEDFAKGIVGAAQKLGDTLTNQTYREIHTVKTRTTTTITRTSWDE